MLLVVSFRMRRSDWSLQLLKGLVVSQRLKRIVTLRSLPPRWLPEIRRRAAQSAGGSPRAVDSAGSGQKKAYMATTFRMMKSLLVVDEGHNLDLTRLGPSKALTVIGPATTTSIFTSLPTTTTTTSMPELVWILVCYLGNGPSLGIA